jgi:hypothetical protein
VSQSSVAKYMVKRCGPPSEGWRTFLRNHAPDIAAMDLFVVPTIGFDLLYAIVIVRLVRRDLVRINVTTHPTAEWIVRQITEAFPWNEAPRYLIRDRDRIYGALSASSAQHYSETTAATSAAAGSDRALMVWMTRLWPSLLALARVVQPATLCVLKTRFGNSGDEGRQGADTMPPTCWMARWIGASLLRDR